MADKQFGVDPQTQNILLEKAQRRAVLREQFLKGKSDPFRHASNEGGTLFDPAVLRFEAQRISQWRFFRATPKTTFIGLMAMVIPMGAYTYMVRRNRIAKEASFRRGEVAYKDRWFKFI